MSCIVIGVAGASGSGKTFFSSRLSDILVEENGKSSVAYIQEDYYYRDQSEIPEADRAHTNYDHPESMEHDLLRRHLAELKAGRAVELPQYDYTRHNRSETTIRMEPAHIIIVEGILLFTDAELRKQFDYLVFVDCPLDICLLRRARRDMEERGRTFDSVMKQYQATVRPMYFQFVEPSRQFADILIPGFKGMGAAIDLVKARLAQFHQSRTQMPKVNSSLFV